VTETYNFTTTLNTQFGKRAFSFATPRARTHYQSRFDQS